jgi:hypothetical protein
VVQIVPCPFLSALFIVSISAESVAFTVFTRFDCSAEEAPGPPRGKQAAAAESNGETFKKNHLFLFGSIKAYRTPAEFSESLERER